MIRVLLIALALALVALLLGVPLYVVFHEAFASGWSAYVDSLKEPDTRDAIVLSLTVIALVVPLNTVFGVAAAYVTSRFAFPGKRFLAAIIDLPLTVSPVVAGLVFVLLFGSQGLFGGVLQRHDIKVIFALPGIVLATAFVTFPLVARELAPAMEAQSADQEEAAMLLGASGWTTFWRITLPRVRGALTYGVVLCTARALGEFGAVSVVSGHIRGSTNTLPLHVEVLYNDYAFAAAFAVSSLLVGVTFVNLVARSIWK
ncbi:sulfate ABC transporter permease subunit CysW [Pendulispora albinea]|uniref:Sulfate ABC transporter permease subunit CysW n=1 Tax=Pendulispora albinea TaxID=2741071 RepID=A0ABZ2LVI8_9BACT